MFSPVDAVRVAGGPEKARCSPSNFRAILRCTHKGVAQNRRARRSPDAPSQIYLFRERILHP
jgi:hypothetical protein